MKSFLPIKIYGDQGHLLDYPVNLAEMRTETTCIKYNKHDHPTTLSEKHTLNNSLQRPPGSAKMNIRESK